MELVRSCYSTNLGLPSIVDGSAPALPVSGPAQRSRKLRPARSPGRQATLCTRGFSSLVASTAALIATGWSEPVPGWAFSHCGPSIFHGARRTSASAFTLRDGVDDAAQVPPGYDQSESEPLRGEVEADDTWVGGTQAGLRGSRQLKGRKAALVLVAVEKRGRNNTGRARMEVIPDFRSETLLDFLKANVAPGSTVYTDGLKSFTGLKEAGFKHVPRSQPLRVDLRKGAKSVVPLADRAIGNLQQWLVGRLG